MKSPVAALVVDWALTAAWPITGKLAAAHHHPIVFSSVTLLLGFVVLLPWVGRKGLRRVLSRELAPKFLIQGGVGSGVTSVLLLYGVAHTTPGNAAIVCQVEIVYSAMLASWLLGERISLRQAAASTLVLAGTAIILWKDLGTPHWKGDAILLGTVWMFQISHIVSKKLPPDLDYATIGAGRLLYGGLALAIPAAVWLALGRGGLSTSPMGLFLIGFHAVVLNSINTTLWYVAIRNLELAKTTAFILSYPALTLLYAWLLGQETVTAHQVAGMAVSMAGAVWLALQLSPQPALATEPA